MALLQAYVPAWIITLSAFQNGDMAPIDLVQL